MAQTPILSEPAGRNIPSYGRGQHLSGPLPPIEEILPKIIDRARWAREQNFQRYYTYRKTTLTEELDESGRPTSEKERTKQVLAKPSGDTREKRKRYEFELTEEIIRRYHFQLVRREWRSGRPAFVITFGPKSGQLPVKQLFDPLLNRARGTLWIDVLDLEVVAADIYLREPVNLVGGIVASVQKLHYRLERVRVDDGVWLPTRIETLIKARQFLSAIHTKKLEFRSDFRRPSA